MITINDLEIKRDELIKQRDAIEERRNAILDEITDNAREIMNRYLIEDAITSNFYVNYYDKSYGLEFSCDIGFQVEGKLPGIMEFGSTIWFEFRCGKISFNVGTIGSYGLEDKFQLKRNHLLYHLTCVCGSYIQADLNACWVPELDDITDNYYDISSEIRMIEKDIHFLKVDSIKTDIIKVGTKLVYKSEPTCASIRLSNKYHTWKNAIYTITKVTDCFVFFDIVDHNGTTWQDKVRKKLIIDTIINNVVEEK